MSADPWKRPSAVDDAADVMSKYNTQLELQLNKITNATPEEVQDWQEKELDWWGDRQFIFVTVAVIVQLCTLLFMASVMVVTGGFL